MKGKVDIMINELKSLHIGDLEIKIPIIQGGMGVRVSTASLASAVSNYGGAGTIASVGLGLSKEENTSDYVKASRDGLSREIRKAKELTNNPVCVNIMVALTNYEDLARTAVKEKSEVIISGAGLPLRLPEYAEGSATKLIPIVSSARAANLIIKAWKRKYDRIPDALIVEGPMAGGHLGFKSADLKSHRVDNLEKLVSDVLKVAKEYEAKFKIQIPVIAAGGVFDGKDIARFLKLGAQGVQMGSRFVTTVECSIPESFKQKYIDAQEDDIMIIDSPVGLPGRALKTPFMEKVLRGEKVPIKCDYHCIITCDPRKVPYCIAKAMYAAALGDFENAVVFAGENVSRIKEIVSVKELMDSLVNGTIKELNSTPYLYGT